MNHEVLFRLVIGSMFLSTLALGQSQVKGQNETEATLDSAITYAQTARQLLNQTMVEYSTITLLEQRNLQLEPI